MHRDALSHTPPIPGSRVASPLRRLLFRKIWLPRWCYASIPVVYLSLGGIALVAALFLPHWTWIVPYLLLIGCGCVHAGIAVLALRWRGLRRHRRTAGNLRN